MKNEINPNRQYRVGLVLLLMCAVCHNASAGPSLSLNAGAWHFGDSKQYNDMDYHAISVKDEGNTDGGGSIIPPYVVSASSSGMVQGGVMKATAQSSYTTGPLASSASAYAQWSDQFRIESAALAAGTAVQVYYSFQLDKRLGLSYSPERGFDSDTYSLGMTEWRFSQGVGGSSRSYFGERIDILSNGSYQNGTQAGHNALPSGGALHFVATVEIGMPTEIYMGLLAQTFVGDGRRVSLADAWADLGNSLYWGGINSVTLADGTAVQFNVVSDSGTDYARSYVPAAEVPEPGTLALFLASAGALGVLRMRRKSFVSTQAS